MDVLYWLRWVGANLTIAALAYLIYKLWRVIP
jgi:hypothetical protein